jgi:peroxiredoxin
MLAVAALTGLILVAGPAATGLAAEALFQTLPVGDKAPLFTNKTLEGQKFELGAQLGKTPVLLFFWSVFCGPCREELPLMQQVSEEFKDKGVTLVGVNLDEPPLQQTAVLSTVKKIGITFTMTINKSAEEDYQVDKLYLITGTPAIYMIGKDGVITFAHVGQMEGPDLRKTIAEKLLAAR